MNMKAKTVVLLSAKLLLASWILAQGAPQTATKPATPAAEDQFSISTNDERPNVAPVFWISSVEVMRSAHAPQLDVIRVRGLASTEGWQSAELVPLTRGIPADGVLDLALIAAAPADSSTPTAYPTLEAVFTIEPGHPFNGVRVHGAANRVTLNALHGYAVSAAPPKDCAACIGKAFVAKGQTAPAAAGTNVIREEELPANLRIIRESEGLGSFDENPNRMTILLNERGQIITALWN